MIYKLYKNDLPATFKFNKVVAIDTETMGLKPNRDRLCLVQISNGDGFAHLIQVSNKTKVNFSIVKKMLKNKSITKVFHYARFDLAVIEKNICSLEGPVFCTKIASKLTRTFGAKHGLADLCKDLLNLELDKQNQTSDWGLEILSESQLKYAASDVLYLHQIKNKLDQLLKRENKEEIAKKCFEFLITRSELDLIGFENLDIFAH